MKKTICLILAITATMTGTSVLKSGSATVWASSVDGGKKASCSIKVSEKALKTNMTEAEAEETRLKLISGWKDAQMKFRESNFKNLFVTDPKGNKMDFLVDEYGNEPEGGHSLWISLHGGGGTTAAANDSQWKNQQKMYRKSLPAQPEEGYYISPRSIEDVWNMWFLIENDYLFEQIISTMIVTKGINPDKVYLMGYSAGGDGVWRMAPRMADHWAASAMMAGHPGEVNLVNVRNMPFTLWVGGNDSDYNRNTEVPRKAAELDKLQKEDPEGYIHDCHVLEGKPHWMNLEDAAAFTWMRQYTRNPYPRKVVWRQENEESMALRPSFYWIKINKEEMINGYVVIAEIKGNTIYIEESDYRSLTFYLNDKMVDLDSEVTVIYGGKELFKGMVGRNEETIIETLSERNDPSYAFYSSITVSLQ